MYMNIEREKRRNEAFWTHNFCVMFYFIFSFSSFFFASFSSFHFYNTMKNVLHKGNFQISMPLVVVVVVVFYYFFFHLYFFLFFLFFLSFLFLILSAASVAAAVIFPLYFIQFHVKRYIDVIITLLHFV